MHQRGLLSAEDQRHHVHGQGSLIVIVIDGHTIYGDLVDEHTRCIHYHNETDIIAIKFRCCGRWYPCFECHAEAESHETEPWQETQFEEKAILCGACGHQLSVNEYFACNFACPSCSSPFN